MEKMNNPSLETQRLIQRTIFDNFTQHDIGYRSNQLIEEYAQSKQPLSQSIGEITFDLQEEWVIESVGGNVLGQKPELNLIDSQVSAYQQRITDVINSSYFSGEQITDIDQLIAMISTDLLDAKTQVGKDQRRLISILYVANGHPSTAWGKRIDEFIGQGGNLDQLPSLFGNLLIENEVRYQYAKTYYDDLFTLYNQHYTPLLQQRAVQYGFNYANLNPLDMVLVNFDELEADKSNYPGFCSVETPIGDSNGDHFALRFSLINFSRVKLEYSSIYANRWEGQNKYRSDESIVHLPFGSNIATDERNELLHTLIHESIHAIKLHSQGIYKKIPPSSLVVSVLEELTDTLARNIEDVLAESNPDLFFENRPYRVAYSRETKFTRRVAPLLGIGTAQIEEFAINQDPIGYMKLQDDLYQALDEAQYGEFIDQLVVNKVVSQQQAEKFKINRPPSMWDIRDIYSQSTNGYGGIVTPEFFPETYYTQSARYWWADHPAWQ